MYPIEANTNILIPPEMWPVSAYQPIRLLSQTRTAQLVLANPASPDEPTTSDSNQTRHKQVVVKLLAPHLTEDREARVLFRDEIRLLQHLHHPSIVYCLESEEEGPRPYAVMEYIPGCDLGVLLHRQEEKREPLPWTQAYHIATNILRGLVYLHNATDDRQKNLGVVYRDLSPANVLLSVEGETKLIDFGLATHNRMVRYTAGDSLRGTFAYLAPELLEDASATRQSDIFAWGIIAWETFTGQRLFDAPHPDAILRQLGDKPILPAHQIQADIPAELSECVQQALLRDRSQRIDSSDKLLQTWEALAPKPQQIEAVEQKATPLVDRIRECLLLKQDRTGSK